jgi:putative tryptophan/tyrosine transport system substrate-binding protein
MRRREFITLVSGTVAAWPLVVRAEGSGRTPLVGFLEPISADTPGAKARDTAFLEGLKQLGWTPGQNLRVEIRWSGGDEAETRKNAAELGSELINYSGLTIGF